jgi:hypothetical protein
MAVHVTIYSHPQTPGVLIAEWRCSRCGRWTQEEFIGPVSFDRDIISIRQSSVLSHAIQKELCLDCYFAYLSSRISPPPADSQGV